MKTIALIPARMGSTRLSGKPLADIHGLPMVLHCYFRALMCQNIDDVYIATCDNEIHEASKKYGAKTIDTLKSHDRASDRCAEAVDKIENELDCKFDIVLMLQGDEPMVTPAMIDLAIDGLVSVPEADVANLYSEIKSEKEFDDPNEIKVVSDLDGNALYFSRSAIPSNAKYQDPYQKFKQVCVIPFRRGALSWFYKTDQTFLETVESIDMLRFLESGRKVLMIKTDVVSYAVDTALDLENVRLKMLEDPLLNETKILASTLTSVAN